MATSPTKKSTSKTKTTSSKKSTTRKTNTTKKATVKKSTAKKKTAARTINAEERYKMIEVAAYYIAQQDDFKGDATGYWLAAEAEINKKVT